MKQWFIEIFCIGKRKTTKNKAVPTAKMWMFYLKKKKKICPAHCACLEWVAVSSSKGSSQPRDQTCVDPVSTLQVDSLPTEPLGKASTNTVS